MCSEATRNSLRGCEFQNFFVFVYLCGLACSATIWLNWIYSFSFSSSVEDVSVYLPLVMPVLAARLGTPEITEPSEELRLNYVTYLSSIVGICAAKMAPYLGDMISILQRTLVDPYPEVKKVTHPYNYTHCMWGSHTWGDQFSWIGVYYVLIFVDVNRLTITCLDLGTYIIIAWQLTTKTWPLNYHAGTLSGVHLHRLAYNQNLPKCGHFAIL